MHEKLKLSNEQKEWFAQRMTESRSGNVLVPSHLINKYKKLAGDTTIPSWEVKSTLIDQCY